MTGSFRGDGGKLFLVIEYKQNLKQIQSMNGIKKRRKFSNIVMKTNVLRFLCLVE